VVLDRERVLEFHEESTKNTKEQEKQQEKGAPSVVNRASYNMNPKPSEGMLLMVSIKILYRECSEDSD
jgi:hypothetical protein